MDFSKVNYHPAAREELDEAIAWYAERDQAVAEKFSDLYTAKLAEACETPRRWARHRDGTRQIYLKPYSYLLVFVEQPDGIRVLAVAHTSRRPGYWRKRLNG